MKKYAVFTMDVEDFSDTECIQAAGIPVQEDMLDGLEEYIRLLDRYNIKSTLFTVGNLAPRIADRIRVHLKNGHRLALHNAEHVAPMTQSPGDFREKLRSAKKEIAELFQTDVEGFRAPCFSMDRERLDILRELGFRYDSSHLDFPAARHTVKLDLSNFDQLRKGIFHRDGFYEFGLSRHELFGKPYPVSGGGYLRLGNWEFARTMVWQYIRRNNYYVFYLHPFELSRKKMPDYKQLCPRDRFYLRRQHRSFAGHVEQIIRMLRFCGYQFVTFEELAGILSREQPANSPL